MTLTASSIEQPNDVTTVPVNRSGGRPKISRDQDELQKRIHLSNLWNERPECIAVSMLQSSGAAVLVSSPSSVEKNDGTVIVTDGGERYESIDTHAKASGGSPMRKNPIARLFESTGSFLGSAVRKDLIEEEMKELDGCVKIVQSPSKSYEGDDFDACREYSYSGDEDDNIYPREHQHNRLTRNNDENQHIHVLGKTYHPFNDYSLRKADESSLFWFTYRCDFPDIAPYGITSDAGWGCMLRSAMMLLAHAMRLHYKGRSWRPPRELQRRRSDPFVRSVLTWFADFPSSDSNLYSLHNMVAAGLDRQVLPGEWYGPGTACYVLRDLVEMHERQQAVSQNRIDRKIFRVYVAADGSVFKSAVEELMTRDSKKILAKERARKERESQPAHPLDSAWECELIELERKVQWDAALVLLIPLRLGLQTFNLDYVQTLAHTFSLPQSIGALGGRPRGARWFYGAVADGSNIFGLDPHTVQTAPRKRTVVVNDVPSHVIELSDEYLRSVHTSSPEAFALSKLDPSVALGFYCRDRGDFLDLIFRLEKWKRDHNELPQMFSISEAAPDYSNNISSMMDDMMSHSMNVSLLDDEASMNGDEEDEYVVL